MDTYTRDYQYIYFLNDKNIVSSFEDSGLSGINPIPSKKLVKETFETVDERIKGLSTQLSNLDYENKIQNGEVLTSLSQTDGKIEYGTKQLISSDVSMLTDYVTNEINLSIEALSGVCDDKFITKNNGSGSNLTITEKFIVDNTNPDHSDYYNKFIIDENGISLSADGTSEYRKIHFHTAKGIDGMEVNGVSLSAIISSAIDASANTTYNNAVAYTNQVSSQLSSALTSDIENASTETLKQAKEYSDDISTSLSTTFDTKIQALDGQISVDGQVVAWVKEEDGKIVGGTTKIDDNFTNVDAFSQNRIKGLVNDLNNLSTQWVKDSDLTTKVADRYQNFNYEPTTGYITLTIAEKTLSVDANKMLANKIIDSVDVKTEGNERFLVIKYTSEKGGEQREVRIKLTDLFKLYQPGFGINFESDNTINVDTVQILSDLVWDTTNDIRGRIITHLSEKDGIISVLTDDLKLSDVTGVEEYVNNQINLSVTNITSNINVGEKIITSITQSKGVVNVETGYITSAYFQHNKLIPSQVEGLTNFIESSNTHFGVIDGQTETISTDLTAVKGYINQLSSPTDGIIKTLSDDINYALQGNIKTLKFNNHLNWSEDAFKDKDLSTIIGEMYEPGFIFNGSLFDVKGLKTKLSAVTKDGVILGEGDIVVIHDHSTKATLTKEELKYGEGGNIYIFKQGVSTYDLKNTKDYLEKKIDDLSGSSTRDISTISSWLSANFEINEFSTEGNLVLNKDLSTVHGISASTENVYLTDLSASMKDILTNIKCDEISCNNIVVLSSIVMKTSTENGINNFYRITLDDNALGLPTFIFTKLED